MNNRALKFDCNIVLNNWALVRLLVSFLRMRCDVSAMQIFKKSILLWKSGLTYTILHIWMISIVYGTDRHRFPSAFGDLSGIRNDLQNFQCIWTSYVDNALVQQSANVAKNNFIYPRNKHWIEMSNSVLRHYSNIRLFYRGNNLLWSCILL